MAERRRRRAHDVHRLVALANPIADDALLDSPRDPAARRLLRSIVASEPIRRNGTSPALPARRSWPGRRPFLLASLAAGSAAVLAAVLMLASGTGTPADATVLLQATNGLPVSAELPADAVHHGVLDWSKVPNFVVTLSMGSPVGFVKKSDLRHSLHVATSPSPVAACGRGGVAVYGPDHRLIGHIYAVAGYRPLGIAPSCPPVAESVTPPPGVSLTGPEPPGAVIRPGVAVPDVRGLAVDRAVRRLLAAGFEVRVVGAPGAHAMAGTVVSESPVPMPDSRLARGSEVSISVAT